MICPGCGLPKDIEASCMLPSDFFFPLLPNLNRMMASTSKVFVNSKGIYLF